MSAACVISPVISGRAAINGSITVDRCSRVNEENRGIGVGGGGEEDRFFGRTSFDRGDRISSTRIVASSSPSNRNWPRAAGLDVDWQFPD